MITGCRSTKETAAESGELAALYNPSEFSLNVDYQVHHLSDDLTSLYVRIFPGELLFNQANEDGEYRALVDISYLLYELDDDGMVSAVSDSSGFEVKLGQKDQERSGYFTAKVLSIDSGKRYMIRLESRDMLRGTRGLKHLFIDKTDDLSSQNFSVVSARTSYPRFQNYLMPGEVFKIKYRHPGTDTVYIDLLKVDQPFPRPPVALNAPSFYPFAVDTTMVVPFSDTTVFTLPEQGMYHFRVDSSRREGITLHNFGPDYPQVKTAKGLMEPLFYIATLAEYNNLLNQPNTKRAVDDFWLKRTNSTDRSRELIRVYYNRVLYSNLFFRADREGWKTDRGMIFILMGPPDRMKDNGLEERWYYSSGRKGKVAEFVFERKPGIYSNQNLLWRKDMQSLPYWSAAVSSWRDGKVYSFSKL